MPMLYSPAPRALNPPTTTAPSSPPMIQATNGPATNIGPMPGIAKKANPNNIPQMPPTTTPPSSPPMIQATNGPATNIGPMPGIAKKANPNNIPQMPPQNAPCLPQYFMRSPTL